MRRGFAIATGIGCALGCASAVPAAASTVSVESLGKTDQIHYAAAPGEANRVVASTDGATVTVRDIGAVIEPGDDCVSMGDHEAACTLAGNVTIAIDLGNRSDRGRVNGPMIVLIADDGPGRDRVIGGSLLDGFDNGPGSDLINGRGGPDFVRYLDRDQDLEVTLGDRRSNDGGSLDGANRDRVLNVESAVGGSGDDRLTGTGGQNTLNGGPGRDVLKGEGGSDSFFDEDGRDRSYGGGGGDLFYSSEGNDRRYGGKGKDVLQDGFDDGADLQQGGPGFDTAQYTSGHNLISLDGRANDGNCADPACAASEEGDNVTGIEELLLYLGDDFLIGSRRDDVFRPAGGADTVQGRRGDDTIYASADGEIDTFSCGPGTDTVVGTLDFFDDLSGCEAVPA